MNGFAATFVDQYGEGVGVREELSVPTFGCCPCLSIVYICMVLGVMCRMHNCLANWDNLFLICAVLDLVLTW